MTERFNPNGHLTDDGLAALVEGTLDELQSLEAAEHLSYCDKCLVRYTDLLTDDVLEAPAQNVTLPVMRRLKQRAAKVLFSRYTAAVAAVAIAGTLWYSGALMDVVKIVQTENTNRPQTIVTQPQAPPERSTALSEAVNSFFGKAADAVKGIGQPQKNAAKPDDAAGQDAAAPEAKPSATATPDAGAPTASPSPQPTETPQPFWKLPLWQPKGDA